MMNVFEVKKWIARWEKLAREAASQNDKCAWEQYCAWIWTAEFIIFDSMVRTPTPDERIPFPSES